MQLDESNFYPCHGRPVWVCDWLVGFQIIPPNLRRHRQPEGIPQHHCVCLFHWLTLVRQPTQHLDVLSLSLGFSVKR